MAKVNVFVHMRDDAQANADTGYDNSSQDIRPGELKIIYQTMWKGE